MIQSAKIVTPTELESVSSSINNNASLTQRGLGGLVEQFMNQYFAAHEGLLPSVGLYDRVMNEVERPLIKCTLQLVRGNQKKAAQILGINRNTLRKKLTELEIDLNTL
jgi:Fis family transcriptional regulator, factor for inversion stimulation protein